MVQVSLQGIGIYLHAYTYLLPMIPVQCVTYDPGLYPVTYCVRTQ